MIEVLPLRAVSNGRDAAFLTCLFHELRIEVDDVGLDPCQMKGLHDFFSGGSVTGDHDVPRACGLHFFGVLRVLDLESHGSKPRFHRNPDRFRVDDQQRGEHQAQDGGGDSQLEPVVVQEIACLGDAQNHERKFTDLCEAQADPNALPNPATHDHDDHRDDDRLEHDSDEREADHLDPVQITEDPSQVGQETDRGEEQGEKDRLPCLDVRTELLGEFGSRQPDSRQKRSEFRGKPHCMTRPGRGERGPQCDDDREVPVPSEDGRAKQLRQHEHCGKEQ